MPKGASFDDFTDRKTMGIQKKINSRTVENKTAIP